MEKPTIFILALNGRLTFVERFLWSVVIGVVTRPPSTSPEQRVDSPANTSEQVSRPWHT